MKHIVIDARIINSSTGRYVERLIHYLETIDTNHRYTLLVPSKDKDFYTPKNPNFTITTCDVPNYSFAEQTTLLKQLKNLKPDLVHFCMPQQPVFYKGKSITTIHDLTLLKTYNSDKNWLIFHLKQMIGRLVFSSVCRNANTILVPTQYTLDDVEKTFPQSKGKLVLTYEAADKLQAGKTTQYKHPFKKYILYVGQQSDYKNIARLGDAHQKLLETNPDLGLILVGRVNKSAKKNQSYFESKNYKNIHFTGFVSDAERDWLYENCAAYVFPSLMEGFGLPGLEAMHYRAPVVSSNATCLPEVYGNAAYYFNPTDTDDMVKNINNVLTDKKIREKLVNNGNKKVKEYSWHRMAQETHAEYIKILKLK